LLRSSGCPIKGIEREHNAFLSTKLAQADLVPAVPGDCGQLEIRSFSADF
jgi:hypothetical protein